MTILGAARRHSMLVVTTILLFVAAAGFIGLHRQPTYQASARLQIGRIDVNSPGALGGFSLATQSLADAYSRAVHAQSIVNSVAGTLKLPAQIVDHRVSATPIPQSNVFTVTGYGTSPSEAVRLSNTTSDALITYITNLNRSTPDADRLYTQFHAAALKVQDLVTVRDRLQKSFAASPTQQTRQALNQTLADIDTAVLRRETLRQLYTTANQGQSTTSLVQVLARATRASSDRASRLQLLLFLGVSAGLLLGLALATWRSAWLLGRATRA